jgi:hypothetical protein
MIVRMNTALANKMLDCIGNSAAGISFLDSGVLEFRTGAPPASADSAATGTVVSTVNAPADAFAAAATKAMSANGLPLEDLSADAAGTIGWARLRDAADTWRLDIDVTATGGGGAATVDNATLVAGQDFKVLTLQLTGP